MKQKYFLFVIVLSALLAAFAYTQINVLFLCLAWSPFFYNILLNSTNKNKILNGFIYGFIYGLCLFSWTSHALKNYSSLGNFSFFITLILSVYYGFYYAILTFVLNWFKNKFYSTSYFFYLGIVSIFVLIEELFSYLYQGIPFLNLRLGFTISKSLYLIQLASIGGVAILTFIVVLINCLFAKYFLDKKRSNLIGVVSVLSVSFFVGILLFQNKEISLSKSFKVTLATGNINPKLSWNESTGNNLATNYISLSQEAASSNPDFILWPESVFPWVYVKNDDLINEILKSNSEKEITHIFGLNIKNENTLNEISNSAVFISNKDKRTSKYIKNISLEAFEKPFLNTFQIPFSYNDNIIYKNIGNNHPVITNKGIIGVLICNEAIENAIIAKQVKNGANCFFVLSNDGWFKDTYISDYHFYIARIMAVAYNKDFALTSNCGTNGFIKSNGEIIDEAKSSNPIIKSSKLIVNSKNTIYNQYPFLIHSVLLFFIFFNFFTTLKFRQL